ncbi:DUF2169 family type VI secretion system accessory protein [Shewanella surugensis]|uniref:DUF2169 domain-containing protein n=1 Tax=Shewanella surugensis TaxID=212020 RepID=A0ABT0LFI5_9GAMM|nr:DUF2169 domain-containing protein [Shewanella surugensis]MCL1126472.1 DUF2169 domain-containing protein [Shewanella surugensis]
MRIIKSNEHAILLVPFELHGKPHFSISMILGFDLLKPNQSIGEQQLWPIVTESLKGEIFDAGLPKIRSEWLLSGQAFSGKIPREVVRISASLAGKEKQLDVYGDRHWLRVKDKLMPSKPIPFTQQALTWEATWGGEKVPENPVGQNIIVENAPLANVFYADQNKESLTAHHIQQPASFLPLAIDHPKRAACMGTYNDAWFREQWPAFPNDFDWLFFNQSSLDQRLDKDFVGGEPYSLINLHPKHDTITGTLPCYQPRAFIRHELEDKKHAVSEVKLRSDTVWFFPENQLGVMIFRGAIAVNDAEALDVKDVLLVSEDYQEKPKALAHYADYIAHYKLSKAMEPESIKAAKEKFSEAKLLLKNGKKTLQDTPSYIDFKVAQSKGEIPTPKTSVANLMAQMPKRLDDSMRQLIDMKARLITMPVPPSALASIDNGITKFASMKYQIPAMTAKVNEVKNEAVKGLKSIKLPEATTPESAIKLAKAKQDLAAGIAKIESPIADNPWHDEASQLIALAIEGMKPKATQLTSAGLRMLNSQKLMLGYLASPVLYRSEQWGLEPGKVLTVPSGWVIPEYQEGEFTALMVRPSLFDTADDESLWVEGSQPQGWHSEITPGNPVVICQDRAMGWLLAQDLHTMANVIEMPEVDAPLSDEAQAAIDECHTVFLFQQNINDVEPWIEAFPTLLVISLKDNILIENAYRESIDLPEWFIELLPSDKETAALIDKAVKQRESIPLPKVDIAALYTFQKDKLSAQMGIPAGMTPEQMVLSQFEKAKPHFENVPNAMAREKVLNALSAVKAPKPSGLSLAEEVKKMGADAQKAIAVGSQKITDKGALDKLKAAGKTFADVTDKLSALAKDAEPKLAALKDMKQENTRFEKLTREQVIDYHKKGLSLVEKDLSSVDLSMLDLSGADFSGSILNDADFTQSNIAQSQFNNVIASKAIFDKVKGEGASFEKALLGDSQFKEAELPRANLKKAMVKGADFSEASLNHANLENIMAVNANFSSVNLDDSILIKGAFLNANMDNVSARRVEAERIKCYKVSAITSDWRDAKLLSALFWGATMNEANFSGAAMVNARFGTASLVKANMQHCDLNQANLAEVDLSQASLCHSNLTRSFIGNTSAVQANFNGANLKQALCMRSDFTGAKMNDVNAMQANFMRATLTAASLNRSNLYNSDLRKVVVGSTQVKDCNFKATLLADKQEYLNEQD